MAEITEDSKPEQPNFNFEQALGLDWFALEDELKKNPERVFCGPWYHIKTTGGEQVDVSVFFYDSFYPGRVRSYFFFGFQPQSRIVARKRSSIDFRQDPAVAGGRLVTGYGGGGYGTVLELVQADVLQRGANENGKAYFFYKSVNSFQRFGFRPSRLVNA